MLTTNRMCGYSGGTELPSGLTAPESKAFFYTHTTMGDEKPNISNKARGLGTSVESPTYSFLGGNTGKPKMNTVTFNNHNIQLISHNGQPYMTLHQIGGALEYARPDKISTIYNEHKEEFDEDMSCIIRHGNTRIRIFNREGAWLIGMFARTPKAVEFRKWVLKTLGATINSSYPCGEKSVVVSEHTRALPTKKELTLSPKIRAELTELVNTQVEQTLRHVLGDIFYPGINQHPSGMPFGTWAISAIHAIGAMRSEYENLKDRQQEVIRLLEDKR